jgi:hypothetical protein
MSSSGTESDSSASGDVDFDDYGEFGYHSWQHRHSDGKGSEMHFEHEHQFVSF